MDVRLSPEQVALRDAAAQVVDRLGVHGVAELDDTERAAKLDAAVDASGWRELRTATDDGSPWASAVEVALVAEELGRGLADAAFLGATLAAELRRRAGAPAAHGPETVVLRADLEQPVTTEGGSVPADAVALDAFTRRLGVGARRRHGRLHRRHGRARSGHSERGSHPARRTLPHAGARVRARRADPPARCWATWSRGRASAWP